MMGRDYCRRCFALLGSQAERRRGTCDLRSTGSEAPWMYCSPEPMRSISEKEERLLVHVSRWGSDGYPVEKIGRAWHVDPFPCVFKTKREAVAAFERYHDELQSAKGVEAFRRAVLDDHAKICPAEAAALEQA